jgi:hypothetical protein
LLRIDQVGMSAGRDRPYCSGKQVLRVNVPVIAYPAGRPIWASPALPGARHDRGAAHDHGILAALHDAGVTWWPTPATRAPDRRSRFLFVIR